MTAMSVAFAESRTKAVVRPVKFQATIVRLVEHFFILILFLILGHSVWGECTHVFHMHCLLRWIGTAASKQQCPMDRRAWG